MMATDPELAPAEGVEVVTDRRAVVLGGGLVLGLFFAGKAYSRVGRPVVNPQGAQPVSNSEVIAVAGHAFSGFAPDAFIRISPENQVYFIIPNVEMGQGIYTGETMLIAEELEVGLDQVQVIPAPPNEALYKQPLLQFQGTGGSTSIRGAWEPLRKAGAVARTLLITAAAQQWDVSPAECRAQRGTVVHPPTGRQIPYGQLTGPASHLKAPPQVALKPPSQFQLLGRQLQRVDTPAKTNGSAIYGIDVVVPGMKFATIAQCPVFGGRPRAVDDSAARGVPGYVRTVWLPNAVAVIGDHTWAAIQGLRALKVTWDEGANANLSSQQVWGELQHLSETGRGAVAAQSGDFASGFRKAHKQLDAVYRLPFLAHATMEPQSVVAHARPDGMLEIWTGTQVPTRAQQHAAQAAGLSQDKVIINNQLIGGGFGRRLEPDPVEQAAQIARQVPYPVKLTWTREEDIQHDRYRPAYYDRISAGLGGDGLPVAWRHRVTAASVTARYAPAGMMPNGVDPDAIEGADKTVYGPFPNTIVDFVQWKPPEGFVVSWWRGVGPTHVQFVVESFVDELAHAVGEDPYQYRRRLLRGNARAIAALDRAARAAGWGSPLPPGVGRGITVQNTFGSFLALAVEAAVSDDGDIGLRRITAAVDCGLTVNPNLVKQQIEGGIIFGLTAALWQGITLERGRVQQNNFNDYRMLRINETPFTQVLHLPTNNPPGGIGETGTTAAAPALCNAVFAATGVRLREIPIDRALLRKDARRKTGSGVAAPPAAAGLRALLRDGPGDEQADAEGEPA